MERGARGAQGKPRAVPAVWTGRKALLSVTLDGMNRALREGPTRDLAVSRAGKGLAGLRESPALQGDAPRECRDPRSAGQAGTEQAGTLYRAWGAQIVPSATPPAPASIHFLSPSPAPSEPVQRHLGLPPVPAQLGMGAPLPLPQGRLAPAFARLLRALGVCAVAGTVLPAGAGRAGRAGQQRVSLPGFLRKTGLGAQPQGSKAGEAVASKEHLFLRGGSRGTLSV